jgi:pilus assembly protein CpaE
MEKIRVLIVDDVVEQREHLKKMLSFEPDFQVIGEARSGQESIDLALKYLPHIVLMDINMPGLDGIAATEAITKRAPRVQVVMMSVQGDRQSLLSSMHAGARDYLFKPFGIEELVSTLRRVYEKAKSTGELKLEAERRATAQPSVAPVKQARLVAVYSPRGGAGCTTLAINLATAMRLVDPGLDVAVVDCDLQFGGVEVALNLRADRSIKDLSDNIDALDAELLESVLKEDTRSGLKAILAPPRPEMAELITARHVRAVLEQMREAFDYVVIDIGSRLQDVELSVLDVADRIILVLVPDVIAVRHARHFLELVDALDYAAGKVWLVMNKSGPQSGINAQTVEGYLKHRVFAEIPLDGHLVPHSVNHGVPYMLAPNVDRLTPVIQQTGMLAQAVLRGFVTEGDVSPGERTAQRVLR